VDAKLTKGRQLCPIKNRDSNHVMLNLHKECQRHICILSNCHGRIYNTVLEMKIWIYWSESNSLFLFLYKFIYLHTDIILLVLT
jgi:hypothetical protein